ncbi:MAG TPA: alkaline phosphatase family protein [Candidatus Binatia bacterium]|nr:alkaline phosphatase family protein [Candidatus Binatia bacterium]
MRSAVLSLLFLAACASSSAAPPHPSPRAAPPIAAPAPPAPPRVVLISVDGWRTDLVAGMPVAQALMRAGSWTLEAETPLPAITVVSHAAMFTGAAPSRNGVTTFEPSADKLVAWRPLRVPTVFQALEARGVRTGAIFQKRKFDGLVPKGATTVTGFFATAEDGLVDWSCNTIRDMPDVRFLFIHLTDIDAAGHAYGWMSERQRQAAAKIDRELAELANCMHESEERGGPPIFLIVTADHGGHGRTHGTAADTDHHVPWMVLGPGVRTDHRLAAPVRLMDTAPTAVRLLGLDPAAVLPDAEGSFVVEVLAGP